MIGTTYETLHHTRVTRCPKDILRTKECCKSPTNVLRGHSDDTCQGNSPWRKTEKKYHTVGTPLDHVEVKIVDNDGRIVPVNKEGELCTRDHLSFLGYWGDKEQTSQVFDNARWYHTGDIAVMDEDGYFSIVGTFKDMINRGGENIYPQEVEEFLLSLPDVAEVQVAGVPDQRMGEEACAWVKLKGGSTVTETELREYCKEKSATLRFLGTSCWLKTFQKRRQEK
ncbi:putative acyl-CoA synthetase YngI [Tachypleus tridentatus]|uniref:putative acyl-CoA synthetase YngI n=1 Tax=Tachypleus tridentatus TaxID=6853 RepID=UPI003FD6B236